MLIVFVYYITAVDGPGEGYSSEEYVNSDGETVQYAAGSVETEFTEW